MKNSGASHLRKILERAREEVPSRLRVYVFDLDSTLFDVEPRMMAILKAFSQEPVWISKHSVACKKLSELKQLPRTFHFEKILNELGLQNESQEFRADILDFWRTRFFCNDWLHLDSQRSRKSLWFLEPAPSDKAKVRRISLRLKRPALCAFKMQQHRRDRGHHE